MISAANLIMTAGRSHTPPWYGQGWGYRLSVTLSNANAAGLSYFHAFITLSGAAYTSFAAHANADGSDVRVTDADGVTLLPHFLEGIDAANSKVYLVVKVPHIPTAGKTVYVYYGKPAATSVSSGTGTFASANALTAAADTYTQSDKAGYHFVPALCRLKYQTGGNASKNGRLLMTLSTGGTGDTPVGSNCTFTAGKNDANGDAASWTWADLLTPSAGRTMTSGSMILELTDGTVIAGHYDCTNANYQSGTAGIVKVVKSTDGGDTWTTSGSGISLSGASVSQGFVYGPAWQVTQSGGGCSVGDILWTGYGKVVGDVGYRSWLMRCPAGADPTVGSNWSFFATIAYTDIGYDETSIAPLGGTSWYALIRYETPSGPFLHYATSADNGATWTAPQPWSYDGTSGGASIASPLLLPLAGGDLLAVWARRTGVTGVYAAVSPDGGLTWSHQAMLAGIDTPSSGGADGGYPATCETADGKILTAQFSYLASQPLGGNTVVQSELYDNDWLWNPQGFYEGCESLPTPPWSAIGAAASAGTNVAHHGTKSLLLDNTTNFVAVASRALFDQSNADVQWKDGALNFWVYPTSLSGQGGTFSLFNSTGSARLQAGFSTGTTPATAGPFPLQYFDGSWHALSTPTSLPAAQWSKITLRFHVGTVNTDATAELYVNNVSKGTVSVYQSSGVAAKMNFSTGSGGTTTECKLNYDDVYLSQYAGTLPAATAGSEESF